MNPTINIDDFFKVVRENGSPLPNLLTDQERSYFLSEFPIHSEFIETQKPSEIASEKTSEMASEKPSIQILKFLHENQKLAISKIAKHLNISTRAVEMQIHFLKQSGLLKCNGSRRKGKRVLDTSITSSGAPQRLRSSEWSFEMFS